MARLDTAGVEGGEVRPYFEIKLNLRDGWVGDCRCVLVSWEMHGGSNSWDPTAV